LQNHLKNVKLVVAAAVAVVVQVADLAALAAAEAQVLAAAMAVVVQAAIKSLFLERKGGIVISPFSVFMRHINLHTQNV
jgi:hypothetical protein